MTFERLAGETWMVQHLRYLPDEPTGERRDGLWLLN
jgi:hypothetical protein